MNAILSLGLGVLCALPQGRDEPDAEAGAPAPARPMPVPRSVVMHRGDHRIVVDGVLRDWPEAPVILLDDTRQLSGTAIGAWRGPRDLAARAFLLWDEEALFAGVKVRDDWHRRLTEDAPRLQEIPPADAVVLTLDPDRDTRAIGRDAGRREDREFWLADVEGQGSRLVLWDRFRGTARFARGASMAVARDDRRGITTYEARIPWDEILPTGREAARRAVLDAQIVVDDFDEITDLMPQTRIGWTFGTGPRIDPGLMGSVMLVGALERSAELPEFPPPPDRKGDAVPGPSHWVRFAERLGETTPVATGRDTGHPSDVLGRRRLELLEELDDRLARFPRVDFLEYQQRIHRRMRRECAGIARTGLPFLWQHLLGDVGRRASAPPPERGLRLFRLPQGGWLVRSAVANFAIDPAGYNLERHVWGALDFVLLTDPLDMTKRNDQILLRMVSAKRPFFAHLAFHLPGVRVSETTLVEPGKSYGASGLEVRVLGRKAEEGWVPTSVGYSVHWPDGTTLVHSGLALSEEHLRGEPDLLILSARHPRAVNVGQAAAARLTVLDDVLQCATRPGPSGRVDLDAAFELQNRLRPRSSLILAPGESWDVPPR